MRIKHLRELKGWEQKELAAKLGVAQSTVATWETNKNGPNPTQRKKLCEVFGISLDELYGIAPKKDAIGVKKIPLISWIHANKFEEISPVNLTGEYVYSDIKGDCIFALQVQNDCMSPVFNEGDIVIVDKDMDVKHNDYLIIADHETNTATFKQLKQYGNKKILHPINPKYDDIELDHKKRYTIVGKVVAMQRKV